MGESFVAVMPTSGAVELFHAAPFFRGPEEKADNVATVCDSINLTNANRLSTV
jgi:hypothetical protein